MARVLVPLPDRGFDPTEVAVPWRLLTHSGHELVFCTERGGAAPSADPRLLEGCHLRSTRRPAAGVRLLPRARARRSLPKAPRVDHGDFLEFDALLLPGGHAPGVRQYLGASRLQEQVAAFFARGRPVGAICHGVLLAARSRDPATGRSVLYERRTTCLTKYQEFLGYLATFWKLGRYYRTYPAYVQDEVKAALRYPDQFERGPLTFTSRDTETDSGPAFVVTDGRYVSARWPGTRTRSPARLWSCSRRERASRVSTSRSTGVRPQLCAAAQSVLPKRALG